MGAIAGKGGNVTFLSGYTAGVYSWTLDYVADPLETTDFGSRGYRDYIPGLLGWSGTFECRLDDAVQVDHPGRTPAQATFFAVAGVSYVGDIMITSVGLGVAVDGVATTTFAYQGSGHLKIAGATTTTTSTSSTTSTTTSSTSSTSSTTSTPP